MRHEIRLLAAVAGLAILSLPAGLVAAGPAFAQAGEEQGAAIPQVALTQAQIDGLIASQADMIAAQPKTQSESDKPDPKVQAKMEAIAKKHGFTGLDQYAAVSESIGIVMAGFDPDTKSYVGPTGVIKKQIAQVQADKSMPAKDKAEALKELKEAMSAGDQAKPPAGNVELVGKNFDKLAQAFQGSGGGD